MKFLLDEMLPPTAATALDRAGHDAITVVMAGLTGAPHGEVLAFAVDNDRVLVTEDVEDFAVLLQHAVDRGEPAVPVVFVNRRSLPRRGALAEHLARRLDRWAADHADPYVGTHWL